MIPIVIGQHDGPAVPSGSYSNTVIDSSTAVVTWVRQARSATAITAIRYRYGARTGTPPTYSIRIEGLDSSGNPDGTDVGGGSPTAVTFTPPASTAWNGLIQTATLANSWTPTAGQRFAIVIRYSSGTVSGANSSSFTMAVAGQYPSTRGFPYYATSTNGSTWTKLSGGCVGWLAGSEVHGDPLQTAYTTATANTNGHRSAAYFKLPSQMGSTYSLAGVDISGKAAAAGATCALKLWDTSWNVLKSISLDGDASANPGSQNTAHRYLFASPQTLNFGTKYYVGFECDGTATVSTTGIACSTAGEVAAYPNGENMGIVTWNGSTTTELDTVYPCIHLIVDDWAGSSGGLLVPMGMQGGFTG